MILVTGGAGFIGSNFVLDWLAQSDEPVINLDLLTYAGNLENLSSLANDPRHIFVKGDIADRALVSNLLNQYHPRAVLNFAAETHVDTSIASPERFIQTNVLGTLHLLDELKNYYSSLDSIKASQFRFLHISTDEVYGTLALNDEPFTECSQYQPNNPYAASKASSDHLVRAYYQTYSLPVLTMHCSNNFGLYQDVEKLIPKCIHHALTGKVLPIYGDGMQIRDWLFVNDNCRAVRSVLASGFVGSTYNVGGASEKTNLEIVSLLCDLLDELMPRTDGKSYTTQVKHVDDRLGHDRRYAINSAKIQNELNWRPMVDFKDGLRITVEYYISKIGSKL